MHNRVSPENLLMRGFKSQLLIYILEAVAD